MVMRVGMGSYFLELVLVLWERVAWQRIDPRRWGRYRDLSLLLRVKMLPSVLLLLSFRASGFPPNRLDWK